MSLPNCVQSIKDSIETSVGLKLFSSLKAASYEHIFNSKYVMFSIAKCKDLDNFNPARLDSDEPYPKEDRPRGQKDLDSVVYHRKMIKKDGNAEPIWIFKKNGKYILLDGAHRIVATYLEQKQKIPAYVINF